MSSNNSIKKIKYCPSKASTCPTICELCNVFPFKGDVEVNGLRSMAGWKGGDGGQIDVSLGFAFSSF